MDFWQCDYDHVILCLTQFLITTRKYTQLQLEEIETKRERERKKSTS